MSLRRAKRNAPISKKLPLPSPKPGNMGQTFRIRNLKAKVSLEHKIKALFYYDREE